MRKAVCVFICIFLILSVSYTKTADSKSPDKKITIETFRQKVSYSVGYHIGLSIKEIANDVDFDIVFQAIKDVAVHGELQLSEKELKQIMTKFKRNLNKRREEKRRLLGVKNKVEGEKFLKENAKKKGVKVTKTGLQYKVIKQGTGLKPLHKDKVVVHYRGTFIDGTEFDGDFKRGEPAKWEIKHLIPGWVEGLKMMKVGAKYMFYIPSELAYKEQGVRDKIGPHAVLIYEVELLGIEPSKEPEKKEQRK